MRGSGGKRGVTAGAATAAAATLAGWTLLLGLVLGSLPAPPAAAQFIAQVTAWDGEWEGTLRHPDIACSPCKVSLTVANGVPSIRPGATFPDFAIARNGAVFAELALNPAGNLGRSVCRLSGRIGAGVIAADGPCGSHSAQAELSLKRISAPPTASAAPPSGRNVFPAAGNPAAATAAGRSEDSPLRLRALPRLTNGITANMKNILPAVVEIRRNGALSTGFVIDAQGYLLTSAQAVGDDGSVDVRFDDGHSAAATVLRRDRVRDVALLKVERGGLRAIPIRTGKLTLTETVFAIGHPMGLSQTVTEGIVSAYRTLPQNRQDYIQASIKGAVGSAGGPLLDANGNVVGVSASGRAAAPGLNFFIPIDAALQRLNLRLGG